MQSPLLLSRPAGVAGTALARRGAGARRNAADESREIPRFARDDLRESSPLLTGANGAQRIEPRHATCGDRTGREGGEDDDRRHRYERQRIVRTDLVKQ